jgi:phospholipid/cholesterol/gamma-HCH transport system substrate-binding protein
METRAHYVAVGGFVLTIIFLAFVAVLWLGRTELSTQYARYDIYFTGAVSGLSEGAPVLYAGIRVGRVADIRIDPEDVERIRVTVEIDSSTVIKTDAVAGISTNILSGVSSIEISGGTKDAPVLVAREGERYPIIDSRRSQLERVYSRLPRLLERLNDLTENLNSLVDEKNRTAVAESLQNLRVASASLADGSKDLGTVISDAKTTLGAVATFVNHVDQSYSNRDGLKDQLAVALTDFDRLAKGLGDTNRQLQGTIQEVRPGVRDLSQRTVGQLTDLIGEARMLVSGLTRLASEIERDPTRFLFGDRREGYRPK